MNQRPGLMNAGAIIALLLIVISALGGCGVYAGPSQRAPTRAAPASDDHPSQSEEDEEEDEPAAAPGPAVEPLETPLPPGEAMSAERAALIALDATVGARLQQTPVLVRFEGVAAYEVQLDRGTIYVDAQTGAILYNSIGLEQPAPATGEHISRAQAIEAARAYAGGGSVRDVHLEDEHGIAAYEVIFTDGKRVYVDATSGQVVYAELRSRERRP